MTDNQKPETSEEARRRIERETADKRAAAEAAKEQPGLQAMAADPAGPDNAADDTAEDRILLDELVSITGQLNVVAERLNAFLKKATTPGA